MTAGQTPWNVCDKYVPSTPDPEEIGMTPVELTAWRRIKQDLRDDIRIYYSSWLIDRKQAECLNQPWYDYMQCAIGKIRDRYVPYHLQDHKMYAKLTMAMRNYEKPTIIDNQSKGDYFFSSATSSDPKPTNTAITTNNDSYHHYAGEHPMHK